MSLRRKFTPGLALLMVSAWTAFSGSQQIQAHTLIECGVDVSPSFVDGGGAAGNEYTLTVTVWNGTTFDYVESTVKSSLPFAEVLPPLARPWGRDFRSYMKVELRTDGDGINWVEVGDGATQGWMDSAYWSVGRGRAWEVDPTSENEGIGLGYEESFALGVIVTDPPEDRSVSFVGQAYRADEQTPVGCKALGAGPIPLHEGRGLLTICAHGVRADGEGCLAP